MKIKTQDTELAKISYSDSFSEKLMPRSISSADDVRVFRLKLKAFYVTKEVEISHGVEIEKPVDPGLTHKLTKKALTKATGINSVYIDAVLWKLGILNNPAFHLSGNHGNSRWHKFTESAVSKVLEQLPLKVKGREKSIKQICIEYKAHLTTLKSKKHAA